MPTFTVTLEEGDVKVLESILERVPVRITVEQLLQTIVDDTVRNAAMLVTNPHVFDGVTLMDLARSQSKRLIHKFHG
mgnify:CR=1 FL=1